MNEAKTATILVADDDRVVLFTLAEGLRNAGFRVVEARDGMSALARCHGDAIDLALLDIRMPGMDGLELARRLRDEMRVPFLFLSAYDDEDYVKQAVESGAMGYLLKPLDVPALLPMLRTALGRATDIAAMRRAEEGLRHALSSNRIIGTAVGLVMAREDVGQQSAFESLRKHARDQQRRLEDVAREMVDR